eukprot:354574-Chlamydomonas_euryale.AAC.2
MSLSQRYFPKTCLILRRPGPPCCTGDQRPHGPPAALTTPTCAGSPAWAGGWTATCTRQLRCAQRRGCRS